MCVCLFFCLAAAAAAAAAALSCQLLSCALLLPVVPVELWVVCLVYLLFGSLLSVVPWCVCVCCMTLLSGCLVTPGCKAYTTKSF